MLEEPMPGISTVSTRVLIAAGLLGALGAAARADVILGNFEGVPDAALDWAGGSQTALAAPKWTYSTTTGVTLGTSSLHLSNAGYQQSLDLSLNFAQRQAFMANNTFSIDITYPAQTFTSGFSQIYQVALNAPGFGFNSAPGTASPVAGSNFGYGGPTSDHTFTLSFNYSSALAAIATAAAGSGGVPNYVQIIFATNSDANHPDFYFDNARLSSVPEPSCLALLTLSAGALFTSRRRK
jgi:hypothetical protein